MDGQLDVHAVNQLEQKFKDSRFVRVDSDVINKLIQKDDEAKSSFKDEERSNLSNVFQAVVPKGASYLVEFSDLGENAKPIIITQSEFMLV